MFDSIVRNPDWIMIQSEEKEYKEIGNDGHVCVEDITVRTVTEQDVLKIYLSAEGTPVKYVKLRWKLQHELKGEILGDAWERGYGYMAWEKVVPYRAMPWYFLVAHPHETMGIGVKVRPNALCFWQADPTSVSLWLDVRNGGSGVILNGRMLELAQVVQKMYTEQSAFASAREFCKAMTDRPVFPSKPVYGANNWYYAYGHSSEKEILADTDYLIRLTKGLKNRPYMVIDDCWQRDRCDSYIGGPWVANDKFPDMKDLAGKIQDKGAIPGIWIRFLLDRTEEIPEECRLTHNAALDPSHPFVLNKIKEEIHNICEWGYRLIKHDFTTFDIFNLWGFEMRPFMTKDGWHFYDRSRTSAEIVQELYRTIYEAAQPYDTLILGCNTIGHLGVGYMHMNRTGDDTSGKVWERSYRLGVNTLAYRMPQHGIFYDVDADCLGVTENIPWEYNRRFGKLLAISGTSLFISVKPGVLTEKENDELAGFMELASKQEMIAEPLDWQDNNMPLHWKANGQVYDFDWYMDEGVRVVDYHTPFWDQMDPKGYFF